MATIYDRRGAIWHPRGSSHFFLKRAMTTPEQPIADMIAVGDNTSSRACRRAARSTRCDGRHD
ncbi:MAG: hypothetical protein ACLTSZ_09040 [Lachnospiraceae bacterium]